MAEKDVLSLDGRVAVVTGAGRGIGAATARALAQAGASVAFLDRDPATLSQTAGQIALAGGEALLVHGRRDRRFRRRAHVRPGRRGVERLDILVNNAGVLHEAPLDDLADDELQDIFDVNLRSAMVCARAALPHMTARRTAGSSRPPRCRRASARAA